MSSGRCATARALGLLALFVLASVPLNAQTVTGTINGTVTDRSGAALPGVTVTIRNADTGLERIVITNGTGFFTATFLPVGRYNLQAELSGFGAMRHHNVGVDLNQTVVQDFILDPAVQETVTVSADAPRIDVTDGEIKQTLRSHEIMSMPNPVPDATAGFLRLASVFSGYMENPTSGQDNPTASSGSSVNFNGAGTRGTTFQINGVNNDDSSENQHRQGVALATIQSFQVLTNSYSAEFGRGYGAVVLVQTKSGTNSLDGELYGNFTDAKWNENDVFNKDQPKPNSYRRNYGLTAGFPIIRDTLFGYANTEYLQNAGLTCCATRGFFTADDLALPRLTNNNDTPANRAWQDSIINRWPKNVTNNAPEVGTRGFKYPAARNWPDRDASARLDYNATMNNSFNARYQRSHQIRHNNEVIVGETTEQNNRQSNFGATWTGIISSNTVQEARYGLGLRSTNVNILSGNDTPIVRINNTGLSSGSFTILGNAGNFPINRNQRDQQLVYNISSARWSRHTLKLGTDLRRSHLNDKADNFSRGFWTFNASCGGNTYPSGIAAFMAGCVASYQKAYGPFYLQNSLWEANAYAQDDWRPIDNLTLNLGARYERVSAPKEDNNLIDYFYKTTGYVDPRLGFAYTPDWNSNRFLRALTGGNGRFSIRGGYGTFHGRVFQSIFSQGGANVRFNPPNAFSLSLTNPFPEPYNQFNISDPTNGFVFDPAKPLTARASLTLIDPNLKMPETRQWNLTFERQVFSRSRLRLSYIGTYGKGLLQYQFQNLPIRPDDPRSMYKVAGDWLCAGTGFTINGVRLAPTSGCPNTSPIADNEISIRVPRNNERRPDSRYTTNLFVRNGSQSWYHAGQIEWESGPIHGFNGRFTYTLSKAIDTGSEATFVGAGDTNIYPDDFRLKKGLSRFDTRHRFTFVGNYDLPFFKNSSSAFVKSAFGGWQLSTVMRLASGTPFTIVDGGAVDFDFDGITVLRPVVVDPKYSGGWHVNYPGSSRSKMPRSAFRRARYGDTLDDLIGRNSYFTDGKENVDLGIHKSFALPARTTLMVRIDAFNVFDHTTWGFPDNNFANVSTFGALSSLNYTPRIVQLGFRFLY